MRGQGRLRREGYAHDYSCIDSSEAAWSFTTGSVIKSFLIQPGVDFRP